MKTRSKKPAASKSRQDDTPKPVIKTLEPSVEKPRQVFILPKGASPNARIVTLPNPATSAPTRYFLDPKGKHGFYEFTRVAAPKKACGSWLLAPDRSQDKESEDGEAESEEGYVLQQPDLFIAAPIDPLFLLLPALWPADDGMGARNWGTLHDRLFFNDTEARYEHLQTVLKSDGGDALEKMLQGRMKACCDHIDPGMGEDDMTYSLNVDKLASIMLEKASRMVKAGLPPSMEERLVKKALEMPELSIRREESGVSIVSEDAGPGAESQESAASVGTSQNTEISATTTASVSTAATSLSTTLGTASAAGPDITRLLRLRTALTFLLASYTPPALRDRLHFLLNNPANNGHAAADFTPLDKHLTHIASLRSEAHALRSISDNISRKRGVLDDDEALGRAEVKKRKKEEEDAKKKSMSHGVKKLAKADTTGMKKMSAFFAPKTGVAAVAKKKS